MTEPQRAKLWRGREGGWEGSYQPFENTSSEGIGKGAAWEQSMLAHVREKVTMKLITVHAIFKGEKHSMKRRNTFSKGYILLITVAIG